MSEQLGGGYPGIDVTASRIRRRVLAVEPADPLAWLRAQAVGPHGYWQGRGQDEIVAAAGAVDVADATRFGSLPEAMDHIRRTLAASDPEVRYFGGMAFDPSRPVAEPWTALGRFFFFVPRWLWRQQGKRAWLAWQGRPDEDPGADALRGMAARRRPLREPLPPLAVTGRTTPDYAAWCDLVGDILSRLEQHNGKVVTACREDVHAAGPIDPHRLMGLLRDQGQGTTQFLLAHQGLAFLGRSPEMLYRRRGCDLVSEALAGTAGGSEVDRLLAAPKENAEQDYVVRDLREAMSQVCERVVVEPRKEVVTWGGLAHLRTVLRGRLLPGRDDAVLLDTLHPTAAVLGYPRELARRWLQRHEPLQRGWYAGPIGWIGTDQSEFAVGIRAVCCHGKTLEIYAGAGIVRGSNPDQEWNEVRSKMRPTRDLLTQ